MRLWLLAVGISTGLWGISRLLRNYHLNVLRPLWGGWECGFQSWVEVSVEGRGYELLREGRWLRDTISLARLCRGALPLRVRLRRPLPVDSLCAQLRPHSYRPAIEWVLPEGHDWVEAWHWVGPDTLWSCKPPPPYKVTLVGRAGAHLYPVVLPGEWGVYPETLWVQGHLATFLRVWYQIQPRVVGTQDYRVLLSPPVVEVSFQVPRSYARMVSASDIEVLVDMQKVLPQDTVAYLQVRPRKPYIRGLRFYPRQVRFTKVYG